MDTISRESNSSYLPVAGIIVGVVAIVLSIVAIAKVSAVGKTVAAQGEQIGQIQALDEQVRNATTTAERASTSVTSLQRSTQEAFSQVAQALTTMREDVAKVQEAAAKPVAKTSGGASAAPVVAGPGEYIVKGGDTGVKIATANGCSLSDLLAVNPGVNWNALKVGQKIKLPAKK